MEKRYDYITPVDYEKAELNGISARLLEQRVRSFLWDVDKAVNTPKKIQRCFKATWAKWREVALNNGIDRDTFTNRVRSLGWDEEQAATAPKGTRRTSKWTDVEKEVAKQNGIHSNGMSLPNTRLRLGWSREDAVGTPKLTEKERVKRVAEGTRKYHREQGVNEQFNKNIGGAL